MLESIGLDRKQFGFTASIQVVRLLLLTLVCQINVLNDTGGGQASQPKTVMSKINLRIDSLYPKKLGL